MNDGGYTLLTATQLTIHKLHGQIEDNPEIRIYHYISTIVDF